MESESAIGVLPYNCEVVIGDNIVGRVTAVLIRGTYVSYDVRWWSGRERKSE